MAAIDPTTFRLSDNFLLSDFMGCDSVYRHGYSNPISDSISDRTKIEQGKLLASELDDIIDTYGHLSVTYGFISPGLSRRIVKYQDPDKPSYHRWDLGAAADICVHDHVNGKMGKHDSPISWVCSVCEKDYQFDRIITYSESEIVCYAVSSLHVPMNKVYENRYMGYPKPRFIKYPVNRNADRYRQLQEASAEVADTWRGTGHPQHHGGGRKQYEHHRIGEYTLLSDFLYSPHKVHKGVKNHPPKGDEAQEVIRRAAEFNDLVSRWHLSYGARSSIVFAIDCNAGRPWTERFVIDYVPSLVFQDSPQQAYKIFNDAADATSYGVDAVKTVRMKRGETRIRVIGSKV